MCRTGLLRFLVCTVSAVLMFSCARPDSREVFILKDKAEGGVYQYALDLSDTLCTYDFWFYSRVDGPRSESLQLNVFWVSPSGELFSETVHMSPCGREGSKELYRSSLVPSEPGEWTLRVRPTDTPKGFRGLGLIYRRNEN